MSDPAFLFYPNDYLGGTLGMTFEEKGAYIELLMMQFNIGHLSEEKIIKLLHGSLELWNTLRPKFSIDSDGLFFNNRLELEQKKRKAYTESRRKNKDGKNQYTKNNGHMTKHMSDDMSAHMEDENRNIDSSILSSKERENNTEEKKFSFRDSLLSIGIDKEIVSDWMLVRKNKKASNTLTAFNKIKAELGKSPLSPNESIRIAVEKSWCGFNAEWLENLNIKPTKITERECYFLSRYSGQGAEIKAPYSRYEREVSMFGQDNVTFLRYAD